MSNSSNKKTSESFMVEAYDLYHRTIGFLSLLFGLSILVVFILISLEKPRPVVDSHYQGKLTRYEIHKDSKSGDEKLWFQITNENQKQLDSIIFELRYPEAFRKTLFEKTGGGLNEEVTITIPSSTLNFKFHDLKQIAYKSNNYVDDEILKSASKSNRWWMLAAGVVMTLVGIFLLLAGRWIKWDEKN